MAEAARQGEPGATSERRARPARVHAVCGPVPIAYQDVFLATPAPCLLLTPELVICDVNEAYLQATARKREELVDRRLFEAFPENPGDPGASGVRNLRASLERARDRREPDRMPVQRYDIVVAGTEGRRFEKRFWSPVNTPVLGPDGDTALLIHRVEDVTDAHRAQEDLAARERRFRALVEHASDPILVVGPRRRLTYLSPAAARLFQKEHSDAASARWGDLAHPEERDAALDLLARAERAVPGRLVTARLRMSTQGGGSRWMEVQASNHTADPAVGGVIVNIRDVTEQQEMERSLHQQALHDQLTAVPNRRWFLDAARHAVGRSQRAGSILGVVLVDVDHFKLVNDTMGHPAGDRLLVQVVERMRRALRPGDALARLGGDEFVVLLEGLQREDDAVTVANRIREAATGRYQLGAQRQTRVTLSIGVSTAAGDTDADTLLSYADTALYEAKRQGRDRIEAFDLELRRRLLHRVHVEHELREALAADELVLHWQPVVDARDGTVLGAEALLRWRHPRRGLLRPGEFLSVAEDAGLMPEICSWVLDRAFAQGAAWEELPAPPRVFVNLAAQQLAVTTLVEEIARYAATHRVEPGRVCVEVSERALDADLGGIRDRLLELRERGFGIALDDFGAGNTALTWLQQLPLSLLKLDRSFVATITEPAAQAIVSAVIQLAPTLDLMCVAEGVETGEQLEALRRLGCQGVQGYHVARPQPADELTSWFARGAAGTDGARP